jgi:peptide methionine sulfoxide reductase MsrB
MNVRESCAVNNLLGWLLKLDREPGSLHPDRFTEQGAREAATYLAAQANRRLMAGVRESDVASGWPSFVRNAKRKAVK